jgi:hypothetical protein
MTMSQVAYHALDESYPPEFWNAVSQMDREFYHILPASHILTRRTGPSTLTQSSSGSETVIDSAATSLADIVSVGGSGMC